MRAAKWGLLYVLLVIAPLVAGALFEPRLRSEWWIEAAAALGLAAMAVLLAQLALIARFGRLSRDLGLDALMQFHREMAVVGLVAAGGHIALLAASVGGWRPLSPLAGGAGSAAGAIAFWLLAVVAVTSFARRAMGLSYEAWQVIHLACAVAIVVALVVHALAIGRYSSSPLVRALFVSYAAGFLGLLAWSRVIRRARLRRMPWEVAANVDVGGSTRLLTLRPVGHRGFRFDAGQFVWLTTGQSPVLSPQHPLSIASAPVTLERLGRLELAIKASGDWSGSDVPALRPGHRVWMDGPFGGFTPAPATGPLVLIAGGIGIAPIRSILLAAHAAGDRRRFILFYAADSLSRLVFVDELNALSPQMNLELVVVLEHPPPDWSGEHGYLTASVLRRHATFASAEAEYFICGPLPMIDAFDSIRAELGIARRCVHTERFHLV